MTTKSYPLERLTRLYDGMDQLQDDPWIETGSADEDYGDYPVDELGNEVWDDNVNWPERFEVDDEHAWHDHEPDASDYGHAPPNSLESEAEVADEDDDETELSGSPLATSPSVPAGGGTPDVATLEDIPVQPLASSATSGIPKEADEWKRFEILPSAPVDHAYYSTVPLQPSRTFMSRLSK